MSRIPAPASVQEGKDPDGCGGRDEGRAEEEKEGVSVAEEVVEDVVEDAVLVLGLLLLQDDYRVAAPSAAVAVSSAATGARFNRRLLIDFQLGNGLHFCLEILSITCTKMFAVTSVEAYCST